MSQDKVVGIDIGGSHITAALVDPGTASVLPGTRARAYVDAGGTMPEVLQSWCSVIKMAVGAHPIDNLRLAVSIPGPYEYETGICL